MQTGGKCCLYFLCLLVFVKIHMLYQKMFHQYNRNYIEWIKNRLYALFFHSKPSLVEVNPLFPVKLFLMSLI